MIFDVGFANLALFLIKMLPKYNGIVANRSKVLYLCFGSDSDTTLNNGYPYRGL